MSPGAVPKVVLERHALWGDYQDFETMIACADEKQRFDAALAKEGANRALLVRNHRHYVAFIGVLL